MAREHQRVMNNVYSLNGILAQLLSRARRLDTIPNAGHNVIDMGLLRVCHLSSTVAMQMVPLRLNFPVGKRKESPGDHQFDSFLQKVFRRYYGKKELRHQSRCKLRVIRSLAENYRHA